MKSKRFMEEQVVTWARTLQLSLDRRLTRASLEKWLHASEQF